MNYRISHANEQVRKAISELSTIPLLEKDQLRCEMKLHRVFKNYSEQAIRFMPTYKFDPNSDQYDTSEKFRTPSWTDRILYHTKRTKTHRNSEEEFPSIQPIAYTSTASIRFSDHRPVCGLYLVAMKHTRDEIRYNQIRDELIRQIDREENDAIPTIKIEPRAPAIVFNNIRYLDKVNYQISIKNIGECICTCNIRPPPTSNSKSSISKKQFSEEPYFDCLSFTPNSPYFLEIEEVQQIDISFQVKSQYIWFLGKQINEILILHVDNGNDTFITLDLTLDMGPFGLPLNQLPCAVKDKELQQYVYIPNPSINPERYIEMKNDPPALYLLLIDTLKDRTDIDLLTIFNNDIQDSIDLIPIRDQIYEYNYNFQDCTSIDIFMILLHLLRSLPEPLISREIQSKIFLSGYNNYNNRGYQLPTGGSMQSHIPNEHSLPPDMPKAVAIIFEQLNAKDRNLFFRFMMVLQKFWPKTEQIKRHDHDTRNILNTCIDVLAVSLLHEHASPTQRHALLLACLNEDKKKPTGK